jgi:ubiquinone/menaquinone biosynthesis C-methylase UbiE
MADVYATISDADSALVAQIAEVLELRAADPQQAAARRHDPPGGVRFVEGDARALQFQDRSFDVVVFHTTLCHVPAPERALLEAARVLRRGGWVAAFDGDYATATVALSPADPLQACADAWVSSSVHDPWLVRRLPGLLEAPGSRWSGRAASAMSRPAGPATC